MTAQALFNKINELIEVELGKLEMAVKSNAIKARNATDEATSSLWAKAAISGETSDITGAKAYVSKVEAQKFGRLKKLDEEIAGIAKSAALTDISKLEVEGKNIYELAHNGYAWVYSQGYGLPVTGGAKVKLIADAIWSDFYGNPFPDLLKKHWSAWYGNIMASVNRALNSGQSYASIAKTIQSISDRTYSQALTVARTEAGRIQSMAVLDSLDLIEKAGGEYRKIWLATVDDKTRASHIEMDGEYADDKGIFHLLGGSGPAPRMIDSADETINCRCNMITEINGERPTERRIRGEGIVPFEKFKDRIARGGSIPITEVRKARNG